MADSGSRPDLGARLTQMLKNFEIARRKVKQKKPCDGVKPDEIADIVSTIGGPLYTQGYLVLSTLVSFLRELGTNDGKAPEKVAEDITTLFYDEMDTRMRATDTQVIYQGLALNSCLLQIDSQIGAVMFLRDGMHEWLDDLRDLYPTATLVWRQEAILLSLASGVPACRPSIVSHFESWLQQQARHSTDLLTRSSSAVALTKLSRAIGDIATPHGGVWNTGQPKTGIDEQTRKQLSQDSELTSLMKGLVISGSQESDIAPSIDAVEGLAYLSNEPTLKEGLSDDSDFLRHLFALVPTIKKHNNLVSREVEDSPIAQTSTALTYGVSVIISNLVAYPPRLTEEQAQIEKLRRMAKPGAVGAGGRLQDAETSFIEQESDEVVANRGKKLIKAGVLPVLTALSRAESIPTRLSVARSYLSLIEPKENRGQILQSGGVKALSHLIRVGSMALPVNGNLPPKVTSDRAKNTKSWTTDDLLAIQALAKLAITTNPRLLFGTAEDGILDAVRPFTVLAVHEHASLPQRFESLMALTNLASASPNAADRVATPELASKLEVLMLDDNKMVRRAAVELLCNIITTEAILPRYGGVPSNTGNTSPGIQTPSPATISRVHVLLGLSDVDDISTQLAASGALATLLSISPAACKALLLIPRGPQGVFATLADLLDPTRIEGEDANLSASSPGELLQLAHRGVVCLWSLISKAKDLDMEDPVLRAVKSENTAPALIALIKPLMASEARNSQGPRQIIMTAAQCLKWLGDHGVQVQA